MKKVYNTDPGEILISSVTVAELEYGASKSRQREQNRVALYNFLSPFETIPFNTHDAEIYGIIRAELEHRGELIGPYDIQIASQALTRDLILVTNNTTEFNRIKKLKLENWI
jgi:tRNA(fMet)-specific endonuclease VapC